MPGVDNEIKGRLALVTGASGGSVTQLLALTCNQPHFLYHIYLTN